MKGLFLLEQGGYMGLLRAIGRFWIVLIVVLAAGAIAFVNSDPVVVSIPLYGEFNIPLGLTFILSFGIGASTILFYFWVDVFFKTLTIRKLKKELERKGSSVAVTESPSTSPALNDPISET